MRASIWVIGLLTILAVTGRSDAQLFAGFGTNNTPNVNRLSGGHRTGYVNPSAHLGSPFRFRNLFPNFGTIFSNRNPIGRSDIPDPNSPEYLKAFGYKRLY